VDMVILPLTLIIKLYIMLKKTNAWLTLLFFVFILYTCRTNV